MSWFHHDSASAALEPTEGIERNDEACALRLPLATRQDAVCAWLHLAYTTSDPLSVELSIRSPSGAPALERTLLRRDLRTAMFEPVLLPGLSVGPSSVPGTIVIVFEERTVTVPVTVPVQSFVDFVRACETLVPMNERAEADAFTRALAVAQLSWI